MARKGVEEAKDIHYGGKKTKRTKYQERGTHKVVHRNSTMENESNYKSMQKAKMVSKAVERRLKRYR